MGFYIKALSFYLPFWLEVFLEWLKYYHACDSGEAVQKLLFAQH